MDPQNNQLPQQPSDNTPGGMPPTPPQPGQQFSPQPGVTPGGQPQPSQFQPQPQPTPQPQQPFAPQPDGGYPTGMPADQSNKKKLRLIVLLVSILVVAALAAVSYFAFFKKDGDLASKAAQKSSNESQDKQAVDLATLSGLTMDLPTAPEGYAPKEDPAPGAKQYSYSSADGKEKCELLFGTVNAETLPGDNLDAIVKPQLDQLRELGASVEGPNAGTALIVKGSGSETYRLPTLDFKFSYQGNEAVVHYSAVILTSGERAVVNRTCSQEGGSVNQDRLKKLDEAAKNIVVTKK